MKNLATFASIILLAFSTTACSQFRHTEHTGSFGGKTVKASNNYVTKDIKVDNFTGINLKGSPDVIFTQKAGKPKVEVYTSDNVVDLLEIKVMNGTLNIGFKKGVNVSYNKLEIRVSSETLDQIGVSGSGDFVLANGLKTNHLRIAVAGSGDIDADNIVCANNLEVSIAGSGDIQSNSITCNNLKASIAGSGDMGLKNITANNAEASIAGSGKAILSGTVQEVNYRISGSGDLSGADFQAKRVSASISGSGSIKCYATEFLKARTSGSGSIGYKGNPEVDFPKKGLHKL